VRFCFVQQNGAGVIGGPCAERERERGKKKERGRETQVRKGHTTHIHYKN
jgi:hypothetical protein